MCSQWNVTIIIMKFKNVLSMTGICRSSNSWTTRVKKIRYFFILCLKSPKSCWHVTRLSRHSVRLMNERRSLHHTQFKVVCRNLFGLWLLKHWKIRIAYRQWRSNFPRRGKKTKTRKEKSKVTYSVSLVMAFLAAESKNRQLKIYHRPILSVYLEDVFCW